MKLEYNVSIEDIKVCLTNFYNTSETIIKDKRHVHGPCIFLILIFLIALSTAKNIISSPFLIWLGVSVGFYIFLVKINKWHFIKTNVKLYIEKDKDYFKSVNSLTIIDIGLVEKNKLGSNQYNWNGIVDINHFNNYLIISFGGNTNWIVVNKNNVINGNFEEFVDTLKNKRKEITCL